MTTPQQLRRAALGLVHAVETTTEHGRPAFTVADEPFAVLETRRAVVLLLPSSDIETVTVACPTAQVVEHGGRRIGVRLPLSDIDGQQLNHWVRRAWASRAPQSVVDNAAAAAVARPGEVGDLPAAIGRAATRALADRAITTLDQVATMPDRELLDIHGVGPKAVQLLRQALSERQARTG